MLRLLLHFSLIVSTFNLCFTVVAILNFLSTQMTRQTNDNQQKVQAIHAVVYEKKLLIELLSIESHVKLFYIHHGHFGFLTGTKITNLSQHVT